KPTNRRPARLSWTVSPTRRTRSTASRTSDLPSGKLEEVCATNQQPRPAGAGLESLYPPTGPSRAACPLSHVTGAGYWQVMSDTETDIATGMPDPSSGQSASRRRFSIEVDTHGQTHILDLSPQIEAALADCAPEGPGIVHLFVVGSTAALSTTEYEPGLVNH